MRKAKSCGFSVIFLVMAAIGGVALLISCGSSPSAPEQKPITSSPSAPEQKPVTSGATFELVNEVFAYGQDTTKLVIDAGDSVNGASLDTGTFSVSARNTLPDGASPSPILPNFPAVFEGPRQVSGVYVSDDGESFAPSSVGRYIVLELAHGREYQMTDLEIDDIPVEYISYADVYGAGTLYYDFAGTGSNLLLNLNYSVTLEKPFTLQNGTSVTTMSLSKSTVKRPNEVTAGEINLLVNQFIPGRYEGTNGDYLEYSVYSPAAGTAASIPLVVWLHGAGEGRNGLGIQNQNVLRSNEEGTAWIKPENQAVRKAYILVPQSPDMGWTANRGTVMVKAVIDQLLQQHPDIDPQRIYIAGNSMGGYGTFAMLDQYPDFFAAAITAPGGVDITNDDAVFSADQLSRLRTIPIWCVSVEGDTVMPHQMRIAFNSLKDGGANVRWTYYLSFDAVEVYAQAHWSWVPVLRNLPMTDDGFMYDGEKFQVYANDKPGLSIMEWLFEQHR